MPQGASRQDILTGAHGEGEKGWPIQDAQIRIRRAVFEWSGSHRHPWVLLRVNRTVDGLHVGLIGVGVALGGKICPELSKNLQEGIASSKPRAGGGHWVLLLSFFFLFLYHRAGT